MKEKLRAWFGIVASYCFYAVGYVLRLIVRR